MEYDRKIVHIDMDAFYASIEQRDNNRLKGKPVIVGGNPRSRGVVATCSYEARKYGIHSAMPSKIAYKRCPYAIFVRPRFEVYHEVSNQIREIFYRYTDIVEPLSLDEAFLDVTHNKKNIKYATSLAKSIKSDILNELGLSASAGVSYNKFLAKVASDYQKPNGLTVITKENTQEILDSLPINKFFGVGKVTEKTLRRFGINNGYDLRSLSLYELENMFKQKGYTLYQFARGIDNREVKTHRERKSVGSETTLNHDIFIDDEEASDILDAISKEVSDRLIRSGKLCKTITLKVKYDDFKQITRSITLSEYVNSHKRIRETVYSLLKNITIKENRVRLLGITTSNLIDGEDEYVNITLNEYLDRIK